MKKIGIIGSDNSHATTLTKHINLPDRATGVYNFPDYRVTHLFGFDMKRNEEVAREMDIPIIVSSPSEMLGEVDAAIVVFRHGDLHYKYAMPFIEVGIPIWVDKPFTIKVHEAKELVNEAEKRGSKLIGGSIIPTLPEVHRIRQSILDGKIGGIQTGSVSFAAQLNNEYGGLVFYGPHVVETAMTIFGFDVKSVTAVQTTNIVTAIAKYEKFQITVNFIDYNKNLYIVVIGDKGEIMKSVETGDAAKYEGVKRFIEIIEGKREAQKMEELLNPVVFLAAVEKSLKTGREAILDQIL